MKISGIRVTLPALRRVLGGRGHEPSSFNRCVGAKLYGNHPGRAGVRAAFSQAAKECRGK